MKQLLIYILFLIGTIVLAFSVIQRELREKQVYESFLSSQKENLLKGWNKSWVEFLLERYQSSEDFAKISLDVDRKGRLIDKDFFPRSSKSQMDIWEDFQSKSDSDKRKFLVEQMNQKGTVNRAISIRRLLDIDRQLLPTTLSMYEKSLIDEDFNRKLSLIFEQIRTSESFENFDEQTSFDLVFIKSKRGGLVELTVPSHGYLSAELLPKFLVSQKLNGLEVDQNPFQLILKSGVNPYIPQLEKESFLLILGVMSLLLAIVFLVLELRKKKSDVLKKVSFLNQLVHEVKTPVTSIKLNSELLLKYGHDEELILSLLKSSNRLNELFGDILLINQDKIKLEYSLFQVEELKTYLKFIMEEFQAKTIITIHVNQKVSIDSRRLRIVIRNLVKNAIRYGQKAYVEVSLESSSNYLVIKVRDEGPGVNSQDAPLIFQEFYRSTIAKTMSPDGLGIGLFIVKKLVSEMNGQVELLNPGQQNAEFKVKVPYES